MRPAQLSDIPYFIQAGQEFCQHTPFNFDPESYAATIKTMLDDDSFVSVVTGEPPTGHSVARLMPNFYNADELVARVFTTWGKGGFHCFCRLEDICRERGAMFLMADSMIDPRVIRFYKRRGMKRADSIFIKAL